VKEPTPVSDPAENSKSAAPAPPPPTVAEDPEEQTRIRIEDDLRKKLEEEAQIAHEQARKIEERKRQEAARKLDELRKKAAEHCGGGQRQEFKRGRPQRNNGSVGSALPQEQRRKELEAYRCRRRASTGQKPRSKRTPAPGT
jgi:hypothetical protein